MAGYTSIMVQAYSLATGKSIQDSLIDLGVDRLVDSAEVRQNNSRTEETINMLLDDCPGILRWRKR
ncbi:hypothetical protein SAMN02745165_01910 [Malonomonas rubra DSM 5091]|uniref:Uncharacterized protein n=1 Tax=Malonomonas rubra DSM 5091 TaxID=1122189 RepID=A0A1M6HPN5_MALRU|nr:hypothetical protein SAMN02745165_01910 [Malonomonas rubra DSM 5091]